MEGVGAGNKATKLNRQLLPVSLVPPFHPIWCYLTNKIASDKKLGWGLGTRLAVSAGVCVAAPLQFQTPLFVLLK